MTVASKHPPKATEMLKLLSDIPSEKKFHLVWMVDAAKADHIQTAQSFQQSKSAEKVDDSQMERLNSLPQWLLKLSFPKESPFTKK